MSYGNHAAIQGFRPILKQDVSFEKGIQYLIRKRPIPGARDQILGAKLVPNMNKFLRLHAYYTKKLIMQVVEKIKW